MNYNKYISGKRVCFVGGCPNIKGDKQGVNIDGFDVVVKTNGSLYLTDYDYYLDYGMRCDVLYTNNQFYREMSPAPADLRNAGVKFMRMKTCSSKDMQMYNENLKTEKISTAIDQVNQHVHGALMGCYIFQDIINQDPAELHITGIDFFVSKKSVFQHDNYNEYIDGYLPDRIRNQGNKINVGKTQDGHDMLSNTMYIYNLFKDSGTITMPEKIEDLMYSIIDGRVKQS
ncbi:MAG TPA: hypothetical protein VMZ04_07095 [Anaerolineae bacterium]|nr:hypothetical protein [Anaerolineae bacterium]